VPHPPDRIRPRVSVLERDRGNPILSIIYGFRNRAYVVIQQLLPEPQASFLSGILLGVDVGLTVVVQEGSKRDRHDSYHRD
jgi:2-keto-3-deoxy-galactonokinase